MNRRGFLGLLGGIAAAAVAPAIILPERRIWAVGFGAPRDVHAALGRYRVHTHKGLVITDDQLECQRLWRENRVVWGDEATALGVPPGTIVHDPPALRVGSQDLTFDTSAMKRWLTLDDIAAIDTPSLRPEETAMGRTFPRIMAEWRGIADMPAPTHAVLWTGITSDKT
jgi:hypothetical protein